MAPYAPFHFCHHLFSPDFSPLDNQQGALWYAWMQGPDLNRRPPGYEPGELPDCSTLRYSLRLGSGAVALRCSAASYDRSCTVLPNDDVEHGRGIEPPAFRHSPFSKLDRFHNLFTMHISLNFFFVDEIKESVIAQTVERGHTSERAFLCMRAYFSYGFFGFFLRRKDHVLAQMCLLHWQRFCHNKNFHRYLLLGKLLQLGKTKWRGVIIPQYGLGYYFGGAGGSHTHGSFRNHWFSGPAP